MTREEILAMPAGLKLDVLVTEKMMAWKFPIATNGLSSSFRPSTDIAAASAVVWKLPYQWSIIYDPGGWGVVTFHVPNDEAHDGFVECRARFHNEAELPLAVCRAALLTTLPAS